MKKMLIAAAIAALTTSMAPMPAEAAPSRVQVGRLACDVSPGIGLIIASSKSLTCLFTRAHARPERYTGAINKVGLDIGITGHTHIEWLVFTATRAHYTPRALAGTYVGASAEATVGLGLGANVLVGGSHRGFALQPVSVQGQVGFNASLALAGLTLR